MSDYHDLMSQITVTENLIRERDMAEAYLRITQEMGPCPQLLAFVNYDSTMVNDDGVALESINIFDQHNFLVSKLDLDSLDALALEGLGKIIKYVAGGWLILNGVTLLPASVAFGPFGVGLAAIGGAMTVAGGLLIKSGMNESLIGTVKYFTQLTAEFTSSVRLIDQFSSSMPSNLDEKAWATFVENLGKDSETGDVTVEKKPFKDSGWNASKAANSMVWMKTNADKLEAADKKAGAKFKALESQLESAKGKASGVSKQISTATKAYTMHVRHAASVFSDITHLIESVTKHFEEKK